jgi:hypothetical protein
MPKPDARRRQSPWQQALSWAGGGAAAGGFATLACGACAAALPLGTVLGIAGGAGLVAGGLGFVLAGGSAVGLGAVAARRRKAARAATAADCCGKRQVDALPAGAKHGDTSLPSHAVEETA